MPFLGEEFQSWINTEHSEYLDYGESVMTTNAAPTTGTLEVDGTVGTVLGNTISTQSTVEEDSQLISAPLTSKYISFLYVIENMM